MAGLAVVRCSTTLVLRIGTTTGIRRLVSAGAQIRVFSQEQLEAAYKAANETYAEISQTNLYDNLLTSLLISKSPPVVQISACRGWKLGFLLWRTQTSAGGGIREIGEPKFSGEILLETHLGHAVAFLQRSIAYVSVPDPWH